MSKTIVVKGGGTTCKDAEAIDNFAEIIVNHWGDGLEHLVAFASAPGKIGDEPNEDKITNLLEQVYFNENKNSAIEEVEHRVNKIVQELDLRQEVGAYISSQIVGIKSVADQITGQFKRNEIGSKNTGLYSLLCSFGERVNGKILTEHLRKKYEFDTVFLDVFDLGIETEGPWDDARPTKNAEKLVREAISEHKGKIVVATPFLGYKLVGKEREITCVGRGGSDWSATYVGEVMGASDAFIYSDKPGLLRADPGLFTVHSPEPIRVITYREASEFASLGASIILDRAIKPAQRSRMKIHILDSGDVKAGGTVIQYESDHQGVKALATVQGYKRLIVAGTEQCPMDRAGATGGVMSLFGNNKMNVKGHVDHGTGADTYFYHPHPNMGEVESTLHRLGYKLISRSPMTQLAIIGEGITDRDRVKMQQALVNSEIQMRGILSGGERDITMSVFVAGEDGHLATRKLYGAFFNK